MANPYFTNASGQFTFHWTGDPINAASEEVVLYRVGINTGSVGAGLLGVLITMTGILLPSTVITYMASR